MMSKKNNKKALEKKIQMFKKLNVNKSVSVTLMFLSENGESSSKTIEEVTGLKQPEVSNAVKELSEKGWITTNKIKTPTAGRPVNFYKIVSPLNEIISSLEQNEMEKIKESDEIIARLREVVSERNA